MDQQEDDTKRPDGRQGKHKKLTQVPIEQSVKSCLRTSLTRKSQPVQKKAKNSVKKQQLGTVPGIIFHTHIRRPSSMHHDDELRQMNMKSVR